MLILECPPSVNFQIVHHCQNIGILLSNSCLTCVAAAQPRKHPLIWNWLKEPSRYFFLFFSKNASVEKLTEWSFTPAWMRQATLQCNVVSHWLGAYTKWSMSLAEYAGTKHRLSTKQITPYHVPQNTKIRGRDKTSINYYEYAKFYWDLTLVMLYLFFDEEQNIFVYFIL